MIGHPGSHVSLHLEVNKIPANSDIHKGPDTNPTVLSRNHTYSPRGNMYVYPVVNLSVVKQHEKAENAKHKFLPKITIIVEKK